jgi:hypothetical protein
MFDVYGRYLKKTLRKIVILVPKFNLGTRGDAEFWNGV